MALGSFGGAGDPPSGGKGHATTRKVIIISSKNSKFRAVKLMTVLALTVGAFAALPALAGAQTIDPTSSQYGSPLQQVSQGQAPCSENGSGSGSGAGTSACTPPPSTCAERAANGSGEDCTPEAGGLPFTGLDVAALAAVAGFLLLAGLGLRRARFGERTEV
jgi:hypothetical protein